MALDPIAPSGVSTAFIYPVDTAGGTGIEEFIEADPGSTNAPIIFEPGCALTGDNLEVWIVASGASADWGGCEVWVSTEATGNYALFGSIGRNVQGKLTATFGSGSDPDTSNTLSVDLTESLTTLTAGTTDDADALITLCYCDGELIAYSAATLTSAYHYDLDTYIRRGVADSTIGSHASGSAFARLSPATYRQQFPPNLVGSTLYFKFPAFNTLGLHEEELADVGYYSYTLTGAGLCSTPWYQSISVGGVFTDLAVDPWDGNYEIFDVQMPVDVTFAANMAGGPTPGCEVAPVADVTLTFQTISGGTPTTLGTLDIASAATTGAYTTAGVTVPAGDRLRLYAPAGVDGTIAGLFGTLVGRR